MTCEYAVGLHKDLPRFVYFLEDLRKNMYFLKTPDPTVGSIQVLPKMVIKINRSNKGHRSPLKRKCPIQKQMNANLRLQIWTPYLEASSKN